MVLTKKHVCRFQDHARDHSWAVDHHAGQFPHAITFRGHLKTQIFWKTRQKSKIRIPDHVRIAQAPAGAALIGSPEPGATHDLITLASNDIGCLKGVVLFKLQLFRMEKRPFKAVNEHLFPQLQISCHQMPALRVLRISNNMHSHRDRRANNPVSALALDHHHRYHHA